MVMRGQCGRSTRRSCWTLGVVAFVALTLIAAAGAAPKKTIAGRWTMWYLRSHSKYLERELAPRRIHVTSPSAGELRFAQRGGRVRGRIHCVFSAKKFDRTEYGCGWRVVVRRQAVYKGGALITLYKLGGFNYEPYESKCRPLNSSTLCRRHPAPSLGRTQSP
jgi:hypothetical protein